MTFTKTKKISVNGLGADYNPDIFLVDEYCADYFSSHKLIAQKLKNKNPYTITVIIDNLDGKFWNNKNYVKKTKEILSSPYKRLLFENFFQEFGNGKANEIYAGWLDKYRMIFKNIKTENTLDDYIIKKELESRYRVAILKGFKNHVKLFQPETKIRRERYYRLPEPFNRVDWRNPYDNIFVWEKGGKKFYSRGGSGSSGARETNSKFILGFSLINKVRPVPSYLFLYSKNNQLRFIKKFRSLALPNYDIGSNYGLKFDEVKKVLAGVNLLEWDIVGNTKEVRVSRG